MNSARHVGRGWKLSADGRGQAARTWGFYLLALTAWVTAVLVLALLGFWICSSLSWAEITPLYQLLTWIRDYIVFVCGAVILVGWVVISYIFIARLTGQLEALTLASASLASPGEEPISLPAALSEAEVRLNAARERALRDARAAREAEQRKNDLVVYLAHDLKTPLTSVIGYLTLLRDEPEISPELRARYTGVALDKAERLEDLINEFFDITRFSLTNLELNEERLNLTRMLEQITFEFNPILAEKGMDWELQLEPDVQVVCDGDKMERVFDNLLRNAVNYGYPDSRIQVTLRRGTEGVVIQVRNHGKTIPPEKLGRLFEQFFRLDSARGSGTGGAGLGLAIAREIVERHGGTITAESADEQILFTVTLPWQRQKNV